MPHRQQSLGDHPEWAGNVRMGVSTNFNKLCGRSSCSGPALANTPDVQALYKVRQWTVTLFVTRCNYKSSQTCGPRTTHTLHPLSLQLQAKSSTETACMSPCCRDNKYSVR
jgi:hypothetical protein